MRTSKALRQVREKIKSQRSMTDTPISSISEALDLLREGNVEGHINGRPFDLYHIGGGKPGPKPTLRPCPAGCGEVHGYNAMVRHLIRCRLNRAREFPFSQGDWNRIVKAERNGKTVRKKSSTTSNHKD